MSTTGHRDVATLEAITYHYQASRQLSTSSTTVDIHFRFDKLLIILIFQQLVDKMLPIRDENAHQTLFSNNKFDRIRHSQTTISLNASTRCERIDVQRRSADVKRCGLYIEIHVQTDGGGQTRIFWKPHGGRRRLVTSTAKFREEIDAGSAQAQLISGNHGWSSDRRTNVDRPTDRFSGLISRSHRP